MAQKCRAEVLACWEGPARLADGACVEQSEGGARAAQSGRQQVPKGRGSEKGSANLAATQRRACGDGS